MNDIQKQALTSGFEVLMIFVFALLARIVYLEHDPIHDELQHLLAARSWIDDGTFTVADGAYTRGALYTIFVGMVYSIFDDSVTTVRLSSVFLGSLWVTAVFVWCRFRISRTVGWVAALLMCFAPGAIFLSQYIRFYSMHGLLFWLGAISIYEIIEYRHRLLTRMALVLSAVACLGVAAHLQTTTLIGAVGLIFYATFRLIPGVIAKAKTDAGTKRLLWVGLFGFVALGIVAIVSGIMQALLSIYLWSPLWSSGGGPLRYHWMLVGQYPIIWSTVPIAVLLAFAKKSAPGMFCAIIFCTAIVFHSFAGMKAERFIYYVMPFFFALGAILVAELSPFIRNLVIGFCKQWSLRSSHLQMAIGVAAYLSVGAFLITSNSALRLTADMLRGNQTSRSDRSEAYWARYRSDWGAARETLLPLTSKSEIVVTTQGLHMLYFVGRFDVEIGASRLSDLYAGPWDESYEFTIDPRTGRPIISSAKSFKLAKSCFSSGTVVIRSSSWRDRVYVQDSLADAIIANTTEIVMPQEYGLRVFTWNTPEFSIGPQCERLPVGTIAAESIAGQST